MWGQFYRPATEQRELDCLCRSWRRDAPVLRAVRLSVRGGHAGVGPGRRPRQHALPRHRLRRLLPALPRQAVVQVRQGAVAVQPRRPHQVHREADDPVGPRWNLAQGELSSGRSCYAGNVFPNFGDGSVLQDCELLLLSAAVCENWLWICLCLLHLWPSIQKFELYPLYYKAPNEEDGWWSAPYFDCGGFVNDWIMTYSIPFFGLNSIRSDLEFK